MIVTFGCLYANIDIELYSISNEINLYMTEPFDPSPRATPPSTPTNSEIFFDKEKRLENTCNCCGLSGEHTSSKCPCSGGVHSDWKKHSPQLTVFPDHSTREGAGLNVEANQDRPCCTCNKKGVFYCMNCNCVFCSGHCADHQINTEWHSTVSPVKETPSILDVDQVRNAFEKKANQGESSSMSNVQDQAESSSKNDIKNKADSDTDSTYKGKGKNRKN